MTDRNNELDGRIARLADDRESGASTLLAEALRILADTRRAHIPVIPVARGLCRAQPSMAALWNAAIEAVAAEAQPDRFARFTQRVDRAQAAVMRFARAHFRPPEGGLYSPASHAGPFQFVTLSASRSVLTVFEAVRSDRRVSLACSESRPAGEGRSFAVKAAAAGMPVTFFADAAIAHALGGCDAVVVGADAIGSDWFINKSGTLMLAAAASRYGVPVYLAATRDKFVAPALAPHIGVRERDAAEVWDSPPSGVTVRNPYFERTPLDLVTAVISDIGVLGVGMIPEVCAAMNDPLTVEAVAALTR